MSANVITFVKEGNYWEFDGQRYFNAAETFSRKNRLAGEKTNTLRVPNPESKTDCRILNFEGLGAIMAFALSHGISWLQFGDGADSVTVSVNYIRMALQFRGANGWFCDVLDTTHDHEFNPNVPTPGGSWGEAKKLLAEATELEEYARLARVANHHTEADEAETKVKALKERAQLLRTSR